MKVPMKTTEKSVEQIIRIFEIALALILICGVAMEGATLVLNLRSIIIAGMNPYFQTFLDRSLVSIIGLEFALMLIKREPRLVLDILIFAIARKMIMTMQSGVDFFLGSLAILLLYAVKSSGIKYLVLPRRGLARLLSRGDKSKTDSRVSSAAPAENPSSSGDPA